MKNSCRYSVLLLLLAALFGANAAWAADEAAGRVDYLSGEVSAIRGAKVFALQVNAPVYASDSIVTGSRGRAKLVMNDGSRVYIGRNSRVGLEEYSSRQGSLLSGAFNLLWGKARFVVEKLRGSSASFSVRTSTAVLGVRGTNFTVSVGIPSGINPLQTGSPQLPPLPTTTLLVEGLLQLRAVSSGREALLNPGNMAAISPAGRIDIRPFSQGELKEMGTDISERLGATDRPAAGQTPAAPDVTVPVVVRPPTVIWETKTITGRGQAPVTIQVPVTVQPPVIVQQPVR